jgi:hypothetical protein
MLAVCGEEAESTITQSRLVGISIMPAPVPEFPKTVNGDATLFSEPNVLVVSVGKLGVRPVLPDESPMLTSKLP